MLSSLVRLVRPSALARLTTTLTTTPTPATTCSLHTSSTYNIDNKTTEDKTPLGKFSAEEKKKQKEESAAAAVKGEEGEKAEEEVAPDPYAPFPNNKNPITGEIGGPRGPEPTRYGDWERKGRCTDF